ncbi:MAG: FAD-dependent oxidoreductase [Candidatus Binatia bacterium]
MHERVDVVVIGAGLAGLAVAGWTARAGRSVVVCEKAGVAGGRAQTGGVGRVPPQPRATRALLRGPAEQSAARAREC